MWILRQCSLTQRMSSETSGTVVGRVVHSSEIQVAAKATNRQKNSSAEESTEWVKWSVLEIRSPHFYAQPSQAQAAQNRSGFVFPSTDQATWLVNR